MTKKLLLLVIAAASLSFAGVPHAQPLTGRVFDLESTATPPQGIEGARITVRDRLGSVIRQGQDATSTTGSYSIPLPAGALTPLALEFRKVGYVDDPARLKVPSPAQRQPDLGMVAKGRDAAYYTRVADAALAQPAGDGRVAYLSAIAALPPSDQQHVKQRLTERGDAELLKTYESVQLTRNWKLDYSKVLDADKFRAVQGQTDCAAGGCKLWIYGAVRNPADESDLRKLFAARLPTVAKDFTVEVSPAAVNARLSLEKK